MTARDHQGKCWSKIKLGEAHIVVAKLFRAAGPNQWHTSRITWPVLKLPTITPSLQFPWLKPIPKFPLLLGEG